MKELTRRDFFKWSALGGAIGLAHLSKPFDLLKAAENAPFKEGAEIRLTAAVTNVDLGTGKSFKAWTYNGRVPGPEIRVKEGQRLRVVVKNQLPEGTTVHWHGLPVPNRMDGVPFVTQKPIQPGETFVYEFEAKPAGTYLYHSHAMYQLDRGLYGSLVVEPQREDLPYDREYTWLLEDWATVDGGGPEASKMGRIAPQMGMMGGMMGRRRFAGGGPLQEPQYDAYTINGRIREALPDFKVRKGDRLRIRLGNPSSSTFYTLRVAGHPLTITHADGRPVLPVTVDALRIGMGERYDVIVSADNPGRWAVYTPNDGSPSGGLTLGTLLYEGIRSKDYTATAEASFRINDYRALEGRDERFLLPVQGEADRVFRMTLSGGMMGSPYWMINGRVYPNSEDLTIKKGERVRLEYFNRSMMAHPMHLHGHFFELAGTGMVTGVRVKKDTIIIPAHMGGGAVEFIADNPGVWIHHCHNLYHMEAGMANLARIV
jgi:multicopper oxidase